MRRPPTSQNVSHDLACLDFVEAAESAVLALPHLTLEQFIPEYVFRSEKDVIEFLSTDQYGETKTASKEIIPDGFLSIVDHKRIKQGNPRRYRTLLEVDMASHSGSAFGEKAFGLARYVDQSASYRERFGHNSGRVLVLTTGKTRMKNLMKQTRKAAGAAAKMFWFTILRDALGTTNLFSDAIWLRGNWKRDEPGPLFPPSSPQN
jgi:hypothetical protein